ncbi:MAG: amidase [Gammaproteobacteria bacterium]|nr:amidase [Gammaproteobacteria bacterium]
MSTELYHCSIADLGRQIANRELSPVDLTESFLHRIEALDPFLDAFITLTAERALEQARVLEDELVRSGPRGPLHGIPFGLKDIYCTRGILTTAHSKTLIDHVPSEDATTVALLHQAGGVLLGKLATHEFAHGGPSFDLPWPPARNPWDLGRFTGGSSSGSGAAVAAGMLPLAMGSDTGGSIRNPAALCGLVGHKPTYGWVSRHGIITNSYSYDHAGPLTWCVEDAAIALNTLVAHDPRDPASSSRSAADFRAALGGDLRGIRIGVIRHYLDEVGASDEVRQAFEQAVGVFEGLGAEVFDIELSSSKRYQDIKVVAAETELLSVHGDVLRARPSDFGEDFLGRVLPACLLSADDYLQAIRERRRVNEEMRAVYARCDVMLTIGPGPAGPLSAWRTIDFWRKGSVTAPFNVTGGPALVQCMGYTRSGLPMSLQLAAAPFQDGTVLKVAHAYEQATPWRGTRPPLEGTALDKPDLPTVPEPAADELTGTQRDRVRMCVKAAGLSLDERQFQMVCAAAPYVWQMVETVRSPRHWREEPAHVYLP